MSNHTPGPWSCVYNDAKGTYNICQGTSGRTASNVIAFDVLPHNAALIAAAPELLAAAEAALADHDERMYLDPYREGLPHRVKVMKGLRAAIAKARGEQ